MDPQQLYLEPGNTPQLSDNVLNFSIDKQSNKHMLKYKYKFKQDQTTVFDHPMTYKEVVELCVTRIHTLFRNIIFSTVLCRLNWILNFGT